MEVIQTIAKKTKKGFTIHIPDISEKNQVPVVIVIQEEKSKVDNKRFFGKLKWKGDALAFQKKLRNEWE